MTRPVLPTLLALLVLALVAFAPAQEWELRACADASNLPYSNRAGEGFENRIAALLAEELGARLTYEFLPAPHAIARNRRVQEGVCDMAMGVADGNPGFLTTIAYYRASYVFVHRRDAPFEVRSFDDPVLADLEVGVQLPAGDAISPPSQALAARGLAANQTMLRLDHGSPDPLGALVDAVVDGEVDVAVLWGPSVGWFARSAPADLVVVPVAPEIDVPFLPMVFPIAIGVRPGDPELRDLLNDALVARWEEVQEILDAYAVPRLPLPAPADPAGTESR